eukprot:sb/3472470/
MKDMKLVDDMSLVSTVVAPPPTDRRRRSSSGSSSFDSVSYVSRAVPITPTPSRKLTSASDIIAPPDQFNDGAVLGKSSYFYFFHLTHNLLCSNPLLQNMRVNCSHNLATHNTVTRNCQLSVKKIRFPKLSHITGLKTSEAEDLTRLSKEELVSRLLESRSDVQRH